MDNKDKLEIVKDNENIESNNTINEVDKKTASASEMVENATYTSFELDYECVITKRNLLLMDIFPLKIDQIHYIDAFFLLLMMNKHRISK